MDAIRYLVDTLFTLLVFAFLLRFLLQLVRANFRDPFADAVVRVTNWLILPLRRVLPPIGKLDTATVAALLLVELAHVAALLALSSAGSFAPLLLARVVAVNLLAMTIKVYLVALLLYAIVSFVSPGAYAPGVALVGQLCDPALRRVRKIIPPIGEIDFSPMWIAIALVAMLILLGHM
jgi:YggT family protein